MPSPDSDEGLKQRIIELELRYTEQQALVQDLSDTVYAQGKALERALAQLQQVGKRLEAEPPLTDAPANERPPHY